MADASINAVGKVIFQEDASGFKTNDEARKFFLDLQQTFIDWNNTRADAPEFESIRKTLLSKIEAAGKRDAS